jgi:hypothetical protein
MALARWILFRVLGFMKGINPDDLGNQMLSWSNIKVASIDVSSEMGYSYKD